MSKNLYEFFEINKDASKEEIKKAYRRKAKETHPDKNNNKREEFELANRYYMILIDDKKREQYDKTGNIDQEYVNNNAHLAFLTMLFKNIVDKMNHCEIDIFYEIEKKIEKNIQDMEGNKVKIKTTIEKYMKIKKRIKSKLKKEENIFILALEQSIQQLEQTIINIDKDINIQKEAFDYLKKGKFKFNCELTSSGITISGVNISFGF